MNPAVLIFAKRKKTAQETSRSLQAWLKKRSIGVVDASDAEGMLRSKDLKHVKLGVVIGGDGTFLTLVRRLERKDLFPLMGVNLGTLGFITEVGREEMFDTVQAALDRKLKEERRELMQVDVWRGERRVESGVVFNDAVLTKDARTSMLKMEVAIGGDYLSLVRADGYIVATPTGSTAYSLSAGGPLLHPDVKANVLVPICPHALSARPMVISESVSVEIRPKEFSGGAVYLVYDGQVSFEVKPFDTIKIQTCDVALRLLRSPKLKWPETLRTKLKMT